MELFSKSVRTLRQRFLSFFAVVLMLAGIAMPSLMSAADKAHAELIGAAASVDINFDWDKFEALLNPSYTIREIDSYLNKLGDISTIYGVEVYAQLGVEYNSRCTFDPFQPNRGWYTQSFRSGGMEGIKLSDFYDESFSKETISLMQKRVKDEWDGDYEARSVTYRLIFHVNGKSGTLIFNKSTPLNMNGDIVSADYVDVNSSLNGYYYIDLSVHPAAQARVRNITFSLNKPTKIGYVTPTETHEKETMVKVDQTITALVGSNDAAYYLVRGVEYYLNISVNQYGGGGTVSWMIEGLKNCPDSYVGPYGSGELGDETGRIYIDPADSTQEFYLTITSKDDPSVAKRIKFYVKDNSEPSIYTLENSGAEYPHKNNYVDFTSGYSEKIQFIDNYNSVFGIDGESNDKVINLEIRGNKKPVKWFNVAGTSTGHTYSYLFTIDPEETSDHIVLTASLREYPECKVECHYFLAEKWIPVKYQIDNAYPMFLVEYNYPAGKEIMLETGVDVIERYFSKGYGCTFDASVKTIIGWSINGKEYRNNEPITFDKTARDVVAKAVWIKNPILEQPGGLQVDTTSPKKSVPVSTQLQVETSWLGDKAGWSIYLEKYDEYTGNWESTKLIRTERQDLFDNVPNSCLVVNNDIVVPYTELQAGLEPSVFAYGTYRYRIVNAESKSLVTNSFNVGIKGILMNPEDQILTCGGTASVTFSAIATKVANTRYEWWYNAYDRNTGKYMWIPVKLIAEGCNVTGYDTYQMTISAKRTDKDFTLLGGQVKCRLINADTDAVILESAVANISLAGHALTEPWNYGSSQTEHSIRCRYCHGIAPVMRGKHNYRWVYSAGDSSRGSRVCADCGYIDAYNKNVTLPKTNSSISARITLNSNDGSYNQRIVTGSQYGKADLTKYEFVNPGYVQIGWAFNFDAKAPDYGRDDLAILDGYYDLYAVWKPIETIFVADLINQFDFYYGGKVEFNEESLEEDDAFLNDYFADEVVFQWIRYGADGTRVVIGSDKEKYFPASLEEDLGSSYVDSKIQLRIIDGDRMYISTPFAFDAERKSNLTGIVVDSKGTAVEDAEIYILDKKTGTCVAVGHTGISGKYTISDIPHGSYIIRVEADGYTTVTFERSIPGSSGVQDVEIKKEATKDVENLTVVGGVKEAMLTWSPVPGAVKYAVYMKSSAGTTLLNGDVKTNSYKAEGLAGGEKVGFTVRPYIDSWGNYSPVVWAMVHTPETAVASKVVVTTDMNQATVSWSEVSGADAYALYQKNADGSTSLVSNKITDTTYTVTGLEDGARVGFCVRAKIGSTWYGYSTVTWVTLPAPAVPPTGIHPLSSAGKVIVTWNAVPGAGRYALYKKSKSGAVTLISAEVTGTSYEVTGLADGETVGFVLKSRTSKGWSTWSATGWVTPQSGK